MGKNIGKNISKDLNGKYNEKFLDRTKNLQQMHLKLLQREPFEKQERQLLIGLVIKLLIELTKVSKNSQENNSETVINEHDNEIPTERYISPEERQDIIDNLRLT